MELKDIAIYLLLVLAILFLLIAIVSCVQSLYNILIVNPKREKEIQQNVDEIMMEMLLKEIDKKNSQEENKETTDSE